MKHLRKAFTNHRLIRTNLEKLSAQMAEGSPLASAEGASEHPPTWRRRKPAFPAEETETVPGFITLWDEVDRTKNKHIK